MMVYPPHHTHPQTPTITKCHQSRHHHAQPAAETTPQYLNSYLAQNPTTVKLMDLAAPPQYQQLAEVNYYLEEHLLVPMVGPPLL